RNERSTEESRRRGRQGKSSRRSKIRQLNPVHRGLRLFETRPRSQPTSGRRNYLRGRIKRHRIRSAKRTAVHLSAADVSARMYSSTDTRMDNFYRTRPQSPHGSELMEWFLLVAALSLLALAALSLLSR